MALIASSSKPKPRLHLTYHRLHQSSKADATFVPIDWLKSPNMAMRLAARDQLLAMGPAAREKLLQLFKSGSVFEQARALAVLHAIPKTGKADTLAALQASDPRLREAALKLLSEDTSSEFIVEGNGETSAPLLDIDKLETLAKDVDAGVRRELLMSLRRVPTQDVEEILKQCVSTWDGQDRFYLEAIRAAVRNREADFLSSLFTELCEKALSTGWDDGLVAMPPFFPIGSNDAFLRPGDQLPPANIASSLMGLAWGLGRAEAVPAIATILMKNQSESIEQAAIIALASIDAIQAGELLVTLYEDPKTSPESRIQVLKAFAARADGRWQTLLNSDDFHGVIRTALRDDGLSGDAIRLIVTSKLDLFVDALLELVEDSDRNEQSRAAALAALGKLRHQPIKAIAMRLLNQAKQNRDTGAVSKSALEALGAIAGVQPLVDIVQDEEMPIALRQRAIQLASSTFEGAQSLMELYLKGALPDDLASEFTFLVHNHSDRKVQQLAARKMPKDSDAKQKIFDYNDLLALQGNIARGRELFEQHKEAVCSRCHRATGEGNLVGPNLASIGTKYGAKELLYHIQYPNAAINYNFVSSSLLMSDGSIVTGLVLDRNSGVITLGLANGETTKVEEEDVEEEKTQTISLMPSGLINNFTPQQVADLVEYLVSLRQGDAVRQ